MTAGRSSISPTAPAVSEVVVDTLTGEFKLLRADLLHDAGDSINPAIDIGQVEGAFIQGMGWLTTEELWWNKDGVLMTHAPSNVQDPGGQRLPPPTSGRSSSRTATSKTRSCARRPPASRRSCCRSPCSSRSATRSRASADHRVHPPLDAPATGEAILKAIDAVRSGAAVGVVP
jgi:xanthine dehydrogenase large subunit